MKLPPIDNFIKGFTGKPGEGATSQSTMASFGDFLANGTPAGEGFSAIGQAIHALPQIAHLAPLALGAIKIADEGDRAAAKFGNALRNSGDTLGKLKKFDLLSTNTPQQYYKNEQFIKDLAQEKGLNTKIDLSGGKDLVQGNKPNQLVPNVSEAGLYDTKIYHGTRPDIAAKIEKAGFDPMKTADGSVWFTDNKSAINNSEGVGAAGKGAIIERALPKDIKLATPEQADKYFSDQLIQMGYDGVKYPDEGKGVYYQIFNADKINKLGGEKGSRYALNSKVRGSGDVITRTPETMGSANLPPSTNSRVAQPTIADTKAVSATLNKYYQ